jgi:hypothetical protein
MRDQAVAARAVTAADDRREVARAPHPIGGRQHGPGKQRDAAQADNSLRPLRRRAEMMARPARVRIRNRNPCVFARRRLFG